MDHLIMFDNPILLHNHIWVAIQYIMSLCPFLAVLMFDPAWVQGYT